MGRFLDLLNLEQVSEPVTEQVSEPVAEPNVEAVVEPVSVKTLTTKKYTKR